MPILLACTAFAIGFYIVLSRAQALWLLLGLELMLNASALLLVATGTVESLAVFLLVLFFALVEAAVGLFLFAGWKRATGTHSLESLVTEEL